MDELNQKVAELKAVVEREQNRVAAHEALAATTAAGLQAQIDALKAQPTPDVAAAIAELDALKTKIESFDADVPTTPPPAAPASPDAPAN